jgi:RpiR family transcriptional regulator, carbohydrate utilization regulator
MLTLAWIFVTFIAMGNGRSEAGSRHATVGEAGGALARLRAILPDLQPSYGRVASSILTAPEATVYRSISEAAESAHVSTATVVRCAQRAGFRGFQDLKLALAHDLAAVADAQVDSLARKSDGTTLGEVLESGAQTLRDAVKLIDPKAFSAASERISTAGRILFTAIGTSAALAQDAAYRFNIIGARGESPADVHAQHVVARSLGFGDVCVAISHTGSTRETLTTVTAAKEAGATTVAITSFLRSPLTELTDITLVAGSRELSLRLEAVASRLAHMGVLDALLLDVVTRTGSQAQQALDRYADVLSEHRL